jgi:hypothetical protein
MFVSCYSGVPDAMRRALSAETFGALRFVLDSLLFSNELRGRAVRPRLSYNVHTFIRDVKPRRSFTLACFLIAQMHLMPKLFTTQLNVSTFAMVGAAVGV